MAVSRSSYFGKSNHFGTEKEISLLFGALVYVKMIQWYFYRASISEHNDRYIPIICHLLKINVIMKRAVIDRRTNVMCWSKHFVEDS